MNCSCSKPNLLAYVILVRYRYAVNWVTETLLGKRIEIVSTVSAKLNDHLMLKPNCR